MQRNSGKPGDYSGGSMMMNTNQIQSKLMSQIGETHQQTNAKINIIHNQNNSYVKPQSQSQVKRHSTSVSNSKNKKSKKSIAGIQKHSVHQPSQLEATKSNTKAKRIGAFAKNHQDKPYYQDKSDKETYPETQIA